MNPAHLVLPVAMFSHSGVLGTRLLLALYLIHFGGGALAVGLLGASLSLFPMLLAVPIGRLVDRVGAYVFLMVALSLGTAGLLMPFAFPGIPALFVAAVLVSIASVVLSITTQNLVGTLSAPEHRTSNFANYSLANSIGSFVGPAAAGFAVDHVGHAWACVVLAMFFAAPLGALALWRPPSFSRAAPHHAHARPKGLAGVRDLLRGPGIMRTLFTGSLENFGDALFKFYMPVYGHSIGLSASAIGLVLAMPAAAAFVMRIFLARIIHRFGEAKVLSFAFYMGAFGLLLMPQFENVVLLGALAFVYGLGMGCTGPVITMLMFANSPPGRSAEALGMKVTFNNITKVASPLMLGSIAGALGLLPVFWMTAALMGWGGWFCLSLRSPSERNARSEAEAP